MNLGLVFSGGGIRGSAHIGVLKALNEASIKPQFISGTSAGSIVAGLYAYGYSPDEISMIAQKISKKYYDVDYPGIFSSLLNLIFSGEPMISGLVRGDYLENLFYRLTKGIIIKDVKIPLAITAVDINNTNVIIFTSIPGGVLCRNDSKFNEYKFIYDVALYEAIRASIAIPGIFKPKIIKRMRLVDGGIRANLPVEIVRMMGARKVIAVNLGYSGFPVPQVDNIVEISLQSIDLMIYQITRPSIQSADIIISPNINYVKHNDTGRIEEIVKSGYMAAKEAMPYIKELLYS
jgi:NTE family protein